MRYFDVADVANFFSHLNVAGRRSLYKLLQRRRTSLIIWITSTSQDVASYLRYLQTFLPGFNSDLNLCSLWHSSKWLRDWLKVSRKNCWRRKYLISVRNISKNDNVSRRRRTSLEIAWKCQAWKDGANIWEVSEIFDIFQPILIWLGVALASHKLRRPCDVLAPSCDAILIRLTGVQEITIIEAKIPALWVRYKLGIFSQLFWR